MNRKELVTIAIIADAAVADVDAALRLVSKLEVSILVRDALTDALCKAKESTQQPRIQLAIDHLLACEDDANLAGRVLQRALKNAEQVRARVENCKGP